MVLLVLRTRHALWATFLLTAVAIGLGILERGFIVPVLVRGILIFAIGGAVFWLMDWTQNRFLALVIGLLGVIALAYFGAS